MDQSSNFLFRIVCSIYELINDIRSCSRKKHPYGEGEGNFFARIRWIRFFDFSRYGKLITIESKISVSCTNQLLFVVANSNNTVYESIERSFGGEFSIVERTLENFILNTGREFSSSNRTS